MCRGAEVDEDKSEDQPTWILDNERYTMHSRAFGIDLYICVARLAWSRDLVCKIWKHTIKKRQ
jgi:hypothetical protein